MVIPELIDIIYSQIIHKYREKIERDDECIVMTEADKDKEILCEKLNEEQKNFWDITPARLKTNSIIYII